MVIFTLAVLRNRQDFKKQCCSFYSVAAVCACLSVDWSSQTEASTASSYTITYFIKEDNS